MTFRISFNAKNSGLFYASDPKSYLSERSIYRREKQGIKIDITDFPLDANYVKAIDTLSGVTIVAKSKWFNSAVVMVDDTSVLQTIRDFSFVNELKCTSKPTLLSSQQDKFHYERANSFFTPDSIDYGLSKNQIEMLNGHFLHEMDLLGKTKMIAVIDNGFKGVDQLPQYDHLRAEGKLIQGPDFVRRDGNVFNGSSTHGTLVLSCMAAQQQGNVFGTAPMATYFLMITENDTSEFPVEEEYWIAAAEWADSAGVDIINTSLGYTTFDDSTWDHTYADMDGNSTRITCGVDMAAKKGMICVNSAGNAGNSSWYYIAAPADADSNLTVGAVGPDSAYVSFSSKGPSFDGRLKPNIVAQGYRDFLLWPEGNVAMGNGTSFSSPIIAGMVACLWEAFPSKTNMEIIRAIEQSATHYSTPDYFMGNGIPDFAKAFHILQNTSYESGLTVQVLNNPFFEDFGLNFYAEKDLLVDVELRDITGRLITKASFELKKNEPELYRMDVRDKILRSGAYFLKLFFEGQSKTIRLVKQ